MSHRTMMTVVKSAIIDGKQWTSHVFPVQCHQNVVMITMLQNVNPDIKVGQQNC